MLEVAIASAQVARHAEKTARHRNNIVNTVGPGPGDAIVEANNATIKLLIRKARGFRNLRNLFSLIYLRCSNIRIPRWATGAAWSFLQAPRNRGISGKAKSA